MEAVIIIVFVFGYLAITLEHSLKIDKLIPALVMMAFSWALISFGIDDFDTWFDSGKHALLSNFEAFGHTEKMHILEETLLHHLGKTAEILVFLIGAMTIVEIIAYFNGFSTIKNFIKTKNKRNLLWIFAVLAFVLSAIIDNLTATIVLISLLQKIIHDRKMRLWFAGLIVIAANAGGAFSPIGDVTTTMLWIANKVSTGHLFAYLLLPSVVCMVVPTFIASRLAVFKGSLEIDTSESEPVGRFSSTMLYLGLAAIVFVPIFKMATHLPPYVGMMLSLGIVAIFAEIYSSSKFSMTGLDKEASDIHSHVSPVHQSLSKNRIAKHPIFLRNFNGRRGIGIFRNFIWFCGMA